MNNTEPVEIDDYRLELENRIRNLLWTVSGDYGRSSSSISLLLIPGMSPFVPLTEERVPPVFMIRIFFDMFGYLQCILIKL